MDQRDFVPTAAGIEAAKAAVFDDPATLAKMMQYALNHLEDDLRGHPEDAMTIESEGQAIQTYRLQILAALRETDSGTLDSDNAWAANMWMLRAGHDDTDAL